MSLKYNFGSIDGAASAVQGTAEIHFVEVGGGGFDNDGRDDYFVTYQTSEPTTAKGPIHPIITSGWDILKQAPFAGSGLDGKDDLCDRSGR